MTDTPILQITDLQVSTNSTPLLEGISLEIPRGGRVGLIGESGSGKSLTALSISRCILPNRAAVTAKT